MQPHFLSSSRSLLEASAYHRVVRSYPKTNHLESIVYGIERLAVLRPRSCIDHREKLKLNECLAKCFVINCRCYSAVPRIIEWCVLEGNQGQVALKQRRQRRVILHSLKKLRVVDDLGCLAICDAWEGRNIIRLITAKCLPEDLIVGRWVNECLPDGIVELDIWVIEQLDEVGVG